MITETDRRHPCGSLRTHGPHPWPGHPRALTRVGEQIRATHPMGFRCGQWGLVLDVVQERGVRCYLVHFPDGVRDLFVVTDPCDPYEFRPVDFACPGSPPVPRPRAVGDAT